MPPTRERRQSAKAAAAAISQEIDDRPWKRRKLSDRQSGGTPKERALAQPQRSVVIDLVSEEDSASPEADSRTPEPQESAAHHVVEDAPPDLAIVRSFPPAQPSSCFVGWEPPTDFRVSSETEALDDLLARLRQRHLEEPEDFNFIELEDFTVYRPPDARLHYDMCTLSKLQVFGTERLLFDGTLSVGEHRHFVRGVPFGVLTIDYDEDVRFDLQKRACIQSFRGSRNDVWYRLGKPAAEYKRYHVPFHWLATFAVFFLDYLEQHGCEIVTLVDFRSHFFQWVCATHGRLSMFEQWHAQCQDLQDFRSTVTANFGYLNKESHSFGLVPTQLWAEVNPADLRAIPEVVNKEVKTVVTPFVHSMFQHMYFSEHLQARTVSENLLRPIAMRKRSMALTPLHASATSAPTTSLANLTADTLDIRPGDVVVFPPDDGTQWQGSLEWCAYVQRVRGKRLDVIWLYHPSHTTFGSSHYPFGNELFFSDHCSCSKEGMLLDDVVGKIDVRWFVTDPNSVADFFVRQKFRTQEEDDHFDFVTLRSSDFSCGCWDDEVSTAWEDCCATYSIGGYVLLRYPDVDRNKDLTPARVLVLDRVENKLCLELLRPVDGSLARSNELMETGEVCAVFPSACKRKCSVAILQSRDQVEFPYDRNGAGDFFFIIDPTAAMPETAQFESSTAPLRGLGMFCGGGNFDRGLEECGAVDFKYAIDWVKHALYSYRANVDNQSSVHYFLGSVNDYLAKGMNGSPDAKIATVDAVDLISAGSPCPGFSQMQPDKQSKSAKRMASLVASVVSYVDFYNPKYLILENVVAMTYTSSFAEGQNVFAQIIAALVALGYQAQQFLMEAWNYGSSQRRSRVFIVASVPGLPPLKAPPHTHGHAEVFKNRKLGTASNGVKFGVRRDDPTVFPHVSTTAATAHLPGIGDGTVGLCPAFTDHFCPSEENPQARDFIAQVPTRPHGYTLSRAVKEGFITSGAAYRWAKKYETSKIRGHKNSKSYQRIRPDGLFPTILTHLSPQDGKNGTWLHWTEPRLITVLEARIAQGFLPHEVIIGSPAQQMKIVGNSVDRWVAFALGLELRKSWDKRPTDEDGPRGRGMQTITDSQDSAVIVKPSPEQLRRISYEVDKVRAGGFKVIRRLLDGETTSSSSEAVSRAPSMPRGIDDDDAKADDAPRHLQAKSTSATPSRGTLEGATEAHGLLTPIQREGSNVESAIMID